jgi:hypothetical protein
MRITMIEMSDRKEKDSKYTEQADYAIGYDKNKATVKPKDGKMVETDNYETGLNCRKPL